MLNAKSLTEEKLVVKGGVLSTSQAGKIAAQFFLGNLNGDPSQYLVVREEPAKAP